MAREDAVMHLHERRKRRRRLFIFLICLFIFVLLGAFIIWILYFSSLFRLNDITIQGNMEVTSDTIRSALISITSQTFLGKLFGFHAILLWPDELSGDALQLLPEVQSIALEKQFRNHTIVAHVLEREPYGIWCLAKKEQSAKNCWWFDVSGFLFKRGFSTEGKFINTVNDFSGRILGVGSSVLPERFFINLVTILRSLKENNISIQEVQIIDLALEEATVIIRNGPKLYYSLRFPAENTASVIKDLSTKSGFRNLEYIDFRVENRAYYR